MFEKIANFFNKIAATIEPQKAIDAFWSFKDWLWNTAAPKVGGGIVAGLVWTAEKVAQTPAALGWALGKLTVGAKALVGAVTGFATAHPVIVGTVIVLTAAGA